MFCSEGTTSCSTCHMPARVAGTSPGPLASFRDATTGTSAKTGTHTARFVVGAVRLDLASLGASVTAGRFMGWGRRSSEDGRGVKQFFDPWVSNQH